MRVVDREKLLAEEIQDFACGAGALRALEGRVRGRRVEEVVEATRVAEQREKAAAMEGERARRAARAGA